MTMVDNMMSDRFKSNGTAGNERMDKGEGYRKMRFDVYSKQRVQSCLHFNAFVLNVVKRSGLGLKDVDASCARFYFVNNAKPLTVYNMMITIICRFPFSLSVYIIMEV